MTAARSAERLNAPACKLLRRRGLHCLFLEKLTDLPASVRANLLEKLSSAGRVSLHALASQESQSEKRLRGPRSVTAGLGSGELAKVS